MNYLNELFSLDGKVAVAIGAGGVLAGAMAEALGAAGARVAVLDLNGEAADARAEHIRETMAVDALGMAIRRHVGRLVLEGDGAALLAAVEDLPARSEVLVQARHAPAPGDRRSGRGRSRFFRGLRSLRGLR